jgi:hypothetical protein
MVTFRHFVQNNHPLIWNVLEANELKETGLRPTPHFNFCDEVNHHFFCSPSNIMMSVLKKNIQMFFDFFQFLFYGQMIC